MRLITARHFTTPIAHHGEGPVWDRDRKRWLWLDMLAGRVLITQQTGSTSAVAVPDSVVAMVRPVGERLLVVGERTVWMVTASPGQEAHAQKICRLPIEAGSRANEGAIAPDGSLLVGTMAYDGRLGAGQVFRVSTGGVISSVLTGTTVSNGTAFHPDGTVIFADSPTRRLRRFRVASDGSWIDPELFCDLSAYPGEPDGLCLDRSGGVWVAMWDGGCVLRCDFEGRVSHRISLPVRRPTSVALGGSDLRSLLITTSAFGLGLKPGAPDGSAFLVETDYVGIPDPPLTVSDVLRWQGS